jgi:hypothetical protein
MAEEISCMRALPASWLKIQLLWMKPYKTAARPQASAKHSATSVDMGMSPLLYLPLWGAPAFSIEAKVQELNKC